jgi:hypothetical protein
MRQTPSDRTLRDSAGTRASGLSERARTASGAVVMLSSVLRIRCTGNMPWGEGGRGGGGNDDMMVVLRMMMMMMMLLLMINLVMTDQYHKRQG